MGSAVLIMVVDVEDAASGLEPRISAMVGDGCFAFSDLRNFLKMRFISLNSGLWLLDTQRARWVMRGKRERLHKQVVIRKLECTVVVLTVAAVLCVSSVSEAIIVLFLPELANRL